MPAARRTAQSKSARRSISQAAKDRENARRAEREKAAEREKRAAIVEARAERDRDRRAGGGEPPAMAEDVRSDDELMARLEEINRKLTALGPGYTIGWSPVSAGTAFPGPSFANTRRDPDNDDGPEEGMVVAGSGGRIPALVDELNDQVALLHKHLEYLGDRLSPILLPSPLAREPDADLAAGASSIATAIQSAILSLRLADRRIDDIMLALDL